MVPPNAWMKDKGLDCKLPMQSRKAKPDKHIVQAGIQPFIYIKQGNGTESGLNYRARRIQSSSHELLSRSR